MEVKRLGLLERIGGALIDPESTFKAMVESGVGVGEALLCLLAFTVAAGFTFSPVVLKLAEVFAGFAGWLGFPGYGALTPSLAWIAASILIVLLVFGNLVFWALSAGIAHLTAKYAFKGEGSYAGVLTAYGYSYSAFTPFLVGVTLTNLMGLALLLPLFTLISAAWFLILWVVAVKTVHRIDAGRGFISAFLTPLTVYLLIVFALVRGLAW